MPNRYWLIFVIFDAAIIAIIATTIVWFSFLPQPPETALVDEQGQIIESTLSTPQIPVDDNDHGFGFGYCTGGPCLKLTDNDNPSFGLQTDGTVGITLFDF